MKICISLRDPAPTDLREGNLRSEGRWERQALEACISNPLVTDIYTAGYEWSGGKNITSKYRGQITKGVAPDTVLLIQDYNWNVITGSGYTYKAVLVNIFMGPWEPQKREIKNLVDKYGNKFMFTIGYPAALEGQALYLKDFIDVSNILVLPVPAVPAVVEGSNFNKKILLWPYRIIFFSSLSEMPVIDWALQKLITYPDLELVVATGWNRDEAKEINSTGTDAYSITRDLNEVFWEVEKHKPFISARSRVKILYSIPWKEMLTTYSNTKLMLPHATYNGGSPCEAGMYGVPFIGNGNSMTFKDCEPSFVQTAMHRDGATFRGCAEFLVAGNSDQHLAMLDKLLIDEEHYNKIGNAYRDFIRRTYTYESFNNHLNNILTSRGLA